MITVFDKFKKHKVDIDDKYIIYCTEKNGNDKKLIIIKSDTDLDNEINILNTALYYDSYYVNKVRIFNSKNIHKFIKMYSRIYTYYTFHFMKYNDYILDIEANKYNL